MNIIFVNNYRSMFPELKGSGLTDEIVRQCLGNRSVQIKRTDRGKPYFTERTVPSDNPPGYFSVSHSENLFACVFSPVNIGLDIQHRRNVSCKSISERYFTQKENQLVSDDEDEFFRIWTRKEAFAKYTGEGIVRVMDGTDVIERNDVRFRDFRFTDSTTGKECFGAVCVEIKEGDIIDEIQISYRKQDR